MIIMVFWSPHFTFGLCKSRVWLYWPLEQPCGLIYASVRLGKCLFSLRLLEWTFVTSPVFAVRLVYVWASAGTTFPRTVFRAVFHYSKHHILENLENLEIQWLFKELHWTTKHWMSQEVGILNSRTWVGDSKETMNGRNYFISTINHHYYTTLRVVLMTGSKRKVCQLVCHPAVFQAFPTLVG